MHGVSTVVGIAGVVTATLYLRTLGSGALIRPETTTRFLTGFASLVGGVVLLASLLLPRTAG